VLIKDYQIGIYCFFTNHVTLTSQVGRHVYPRTVLSVNQYFKKYKPITNTAWVRARLCKLQKGCTRLASDKVYQLLAHGRWFSLGSPASSTTKIGRHDIAEILLKVALSTINQIKSNQINPSN
jgi:hypothetical protein